MMSVYADSYFKMSESSIDLLHGPAVWNKFESSYSSHIIDKMYSLIFNLQRKLLLKQSKIPMLPLVIVLV